jgi:hypothetical protein
MIFINPYLMGYNSKINKNPTSLVAVGGGVIWYWDIVDAVNNEPLWKRDGVVRGNGTKP